MTTVGLRVLFSIVSFFALACSFAADKAARAIIVKGDVTFVVDGKSEKVERNKWLPEGAEVITQKGSFAKLMFIDRSSINVGPESQMKIETFPQDKAGIISLVKGKIRSKVTKNYMDNKETDKSKLFIKTKTAAMGVRGTDFQVSFNEENAATSLVTFEGAVAMGQIDGNLGRFDQSKLESIVSSPNAVIVRRGQFSGASPKQEKVTTPTKISPVQLETLQKNEVPGISTSSTSSDGKGAANTPAVELAKGPAKKYRSVVPPGIDAKTVANTSSSLGSAIVSAAGPAAARSPASAPAIVAATTKIDVVIPTDAPKAGGFIDIETAQYIPPPEGSTYDANAEVYVPPTDVGHVDPATGNYANDYYNLNPDGSFSAKNEVTLASSSDGSRDPASVSGTTDAPPPPPTVLDTANPEGVNLGDIAGTNVGDQPLIDPNLINTLTNENQDTINDFQNSDNNQVFGSGTTTNVTVRPVVE